MYGSLTILDLIVIAVTLFSSFFASVRGITREILEVFTWIASIYLTWKLYPIVLPFTLHYVHNVKLSLLLSISAILVSAMTIISFVSVKLSNYILDSKVGTFDRIFGFGFGFLRGALICSIGWLFLTWLVQDRLPYWAQNAFFRHSLQTTSELIKDKFPASASNITELLRMNGKK